MSEVIKIRKGLDIKLKGEADKIFIKAPRSKTYAVKPVDFHSLTPKIVAKPCVEVKVGSTLFCDKYHPEIKYASPVSGIVTKIVRGERRRIIEIVIEDDGKDAFETFKKGDPDSMKREEIIENLLESGIWPVIHQRPYDIVALPSDVPRDIFISGFDSGPLAPDYDFIMKEKDEDFQVGINVLRKLTDGKVHLGLDADYPAAKAYTGAKNVEKHYFRGSHPSGNVGIQIHKIAPINRGEKVWTVKPQDVVTIGNLFRTGKYDPRVIVALCGSEVKKPVYYKLIRGARVASIVKDNIVQDNVRYISGNVLTGRKIDGEEGHIGFSDSQVTVIPEGDYYEMFGWITPGFNKFSVSRSFFSWIMPGKEYRLDTNIHGGERAFVMTGEYEKVFPMDIYPVQLLKAILIEDIDKMEQLGIYEVVEEDMALCEFVCTSKTPVQSILRNGFKIMMKELE
ncbi:MAG: Na(+)-translocating NADH-quinone reductase subunit A [Bacteroidales bacterium]|nr:Na(+)-translocating NADH-quinone reductase subunit A [Bacteroidales bacterium]